LLFRTLVLNTEGVVQGKFRAVICQRCHPNLQTLYGVFAFIIARFIKDRNGGLVRIEQKILARRGGYFKHHL